MYKKSGGIFFSHFSLKSFRSFSHTPPINTITITWKCDEKGMKQENALQRFHFLFSSFICLFFPFHLTLSLSLHHLSVSLSLHLWVSVCVYEASKSNNYWMRNVFQLLMESKTKKKWIFLFSLKGSIQSFWWRDGWERGKNIKQIYITHILKPISISGYVGKRGKAEKKR